MSTNLCLQVNIKEISDNIKCKIYSIYKSLDVGVSSLNKLNVYIKPIYENIKAKVNIYNGILVRTYDIKREEHLKVKLGVVCSITDVKYVNVSPEEVVWITPEHGIVYSVDSNTDWIITIN